MEEDLSSNLNNLSIAQKAKRKLDETGTISGNDELRDYAAKAFKYECISLKYRADEPTREIGEKYMKSLKGMGLLLVIFHIMNKRLYHYH